MLAIGHARISFNSIEWIHRRYSMEGGHVASFNSIEWIPRLGAPGPPSAPPRLSIPLNGFCTISVHVHYGNLSSPLYGFYSIKPPGGDSMYMV